MLIWTGSNGHDDHRLGAVGIFPAHPAIILA